MSNDFQKTTCISGGTLMPQSNPPSIVPSGSVSDLSGLSMAASQLVRSASSSTLDDDSALPIKSPKEGCLIRRFSILTKSLVQYQWWTSEYAWWCGSRSVNLLPSFRLLSKDESHLLCSFLIYIHHLLSYDDQKTIQTFPFIHIERVFQKITPSLFRRFMIIHKYLLYYDSLFIQKSSKWTKSHETQNSLTRGPRDYFSSLQAF